MMNAVVIDEQGEPEVMQYRQIEMPPLQSRQVRIAMRACSLNYHDVSCLCVTFLAPKII